MNQRIITQAISTEGLAETAEAVQRLRLGLKDRSELHSWIASDAELKTVEYVRQLNRHDSTQSLGAKPTGHLQKSAAAIESQSDAESAYVVIPRWTGLGRAFGDVILLPGSGKTYLTLPAAKETYGKRVGEFAPDTFAFTILGGRYPALVFREGWKLAYWLRRSVRQEQDRSLLPSDTAYRTFAKRSTVRYVQTLVEGRAA